VQNNNSAKKECKEKGVCRLKIKDQRGVEEEEEEE
jgi:hypothetical protein